MHINAPSSLKDKGDNKVKIALLFFMERSVSWITDKTCLHIQNPLEI